MSQYIRSIAFTIAIIGFLQIPIMIFADRVTGNYWRDIWMENKQMEPRAQSIFLFFIISYILLVVGEVVDYAKSKGYFKKS